MSIAIVSHPFCLRHDMGEEHPEQPARLTAIQDQLIASGLEFVAPQIDATPIAPALLSLVHEQAYIDSLYQRSPVEGHIWLDEDTLMMPHTLAAALYAAGAAVDAVDLVAGGKMKAAFCAVRPPGHHAERDKAMGFCVFNNIAIAAAYAQKHHGLQRVAIVDFDVHHGNGTEHIFNDNPDVLFCSTFEHPFYPFSGHDSCKAHIVNVPLEAAATGAAFREAVSAHWLPALERFKPEMLFISAGFDAHIEDDMSHIGLVEADYLWVSRALKKIADRYCQGRIVSCLEGGYALSALARSVVAHLKGLMGD
ncbi:histone deacetylase family protein [Exilibacterium tricleocarpae]|uniref:Histone deacetylase family protein n=1 Tax=Exilibacterium tricleocarpae TaxID=2591008 RepID=A0A545SRV4_9GAMM|nr:histone deacetylase family protein [Exilibacterium tricleocarpae]TQV67711.1 histone deacetylase family protein [Exilibacterium tricleocarpae]